MSLSPVEPLTNDSLRSIHPQAARAVFWELEPSLVDEVIARGDAKFEKEAWISSTLMSFGCCGHSIYSEEFGRAVATIFYCSRDDAPGSAALPTSPVSPDAAILTSLFIDPGYAGMGLEAVLLDASIMDLTEKSADGSGGSGGVFKAVEAFGWREDYLARMDPDDVAPELAGILDQATEIGLMSEDLLRGAGFEVVEEHPVLPRLRLDLPPEQELLSAQAVEQLLASVSA